MELVREIGSYAGFAAILGLAILSALYFSQARDLRRLREWAGRAPERSAGAARTGMVAPARPVSPPPRPSAAGGETAEQPPVPRGDGAGQPSPATAAAAGAAAASAGTAPPPPTAAPPLPRPVHGGSASPAHGMVADATPGRRRWLQPRYVALAVAGILVVGGGAAFAIQQLLWDPSPAPTAGPQPVEPSPAPAPGPVAPSAVTFSVLNGTTVSGLAKRVADRLEAAGYRRGNVTNAPQQKAESVVMYADGARRPALAVARRLKISQLERIDPRSQALAGDATVVVIVGGDQVR